VSTAQLPLFLGLAGYYRKFVHKFADQTTQPSVLTADQSTCRCLRKNLVEFDDIRRASASTLVLALCNPDRDYSLCTHASDVVIGDVLAQKQLRGAEGWLVECPLGYYALKNYMAAKRIMQHTTTSYWRSTTIWCTRSLTLKIAIRQCIQTKRHYIIS